MTAKRCIDGAAQASVTGSVSELAGGQYLFAPSQADTNGDLIGYLFTATSAIPVNIHVRTTAADLSDAVRLGLTALPNAAANASGGLVGCVRGGTAQAGASSTITLDSGASATNNFYQDCMVFLTGGTGAGQVRSLQSYVGSTKVATIFPAWSTNPDATSTFTLIPFGQVDVGNWLNGAIPAVNTTGVPLVDTKYVSGTSQTARDIGASVLLSAGTGAGQLDFTSGVVKSNVTQSNGTTNASVAGYFAPDWSHVNAPSSTVALSGTTVGTVTTVTNQLTAAAIATGVWTDTTAGDFTVSASVGKSIMNGVSLGTGLTVAAATNLTNLPSIPANWITAAGINASALNGKGDWLLSSSYTTPPTTAQIATGVWTDTTAGDFTTALSVGKSLMNGISLGTGLKVAECVLVDTLTTYTGNTVQTGDSFARIGSTGSGLTSLAPASTALSSATWTGTLATNLTTLASHDPGATLGTSTLTGAQAATAVWQDATAGDFTTASSIGKSLYNAFTSNTSVFTTASLVNAPTGGSAPTAAAIATAVWQDLTSTSDFSTAGSIGALLKADINAPIGSIPTNPYTGTPPTAAAIATAVWTDTTASDFTTALSVGKSLMNGVSLGTGLTVANLANAPTAGDLTAAMKASVTAAATAATPTAAGVTAGVTLAASQHVIVDSGTVTTLTNLPTIPANWLTAAGVNAGALNGKGDWNTTTPPTTAAIAAAVMGDVTDTVGADVVTLLGRVTGAVALAGSAPSWYAAAPTAAQVADTTLRRTAAHVEASSDGDALSLDSVYGFLRMAQDASASGTTLTVKKSDGSTLGTKTLTVSAGADPITGVS